MECLYEGLIISITHCTDCSGLGMASLSSCNLFVLYYQLDEDSTSLHEDEVDEDVQAEG